MGVNMANKDPDDESLRLVYQTSCELHKFFLSWRHQLLAGYLATVAGLGIAFGWTYVSANNARGLASIVCLLGLFLTIIFWLLEHRNRSLYRTCQNVASDIEFRFGFHLEAKSTKEMGVFTALIQTSKGIITHSRMIDLLFGAASLAFLASAILSFYCIR